MDNLSSRTDALQADFSGLNELSKSLTKVYARLQAHGGGQSKPGETKTLQQFDGYFEPLIQQELGKALTEVRKIAMSKVPDNAGSAKSAILRRQYKNRNAGNINILGSKKRISYMKRTYPERTGGNSGIRRSRTVSSRTKKLYEYAGPDRSFILRFLEYGTDVRVARSSGPSGRGSQATYGARGSIGARSFFGKVKPDMDAAAKQLGTTLVNYVEKWVQQNFNEKK